ncbi:MAG: ABC transporter permease [Chloroflexi bacterium]|nr:ABC transporter permease [Chloroflexota bacterium]
MPTLILAELTFREMLRKKALLAGLVLAAAFIALYSIGAHFAFREWRATLELGRGSPMMTTYFASQLELAGLYDFLAGLLAIFLTAGIVAGEVESGALQTIAVKPISRWQIVAGKGLGCSVLAVAYLLLSAGALMLATYVIGEYLPPQPVPALAVITLELVALVAVTLLGSTLFQTLAAGIAVFMLFGMGLMGGMVEFIGSALHNEAMVNLGIVSSLLMPSDALWRLAAHLLQPASVGIPVEAISPFTSPSTPSIWMVAYAAFYAALTLGGALWAFQHRDL